MAVSMVFFSLTGFGHYFRLITFITIRKKKSCTKPECSSIENPAVKIVIYPQSISMYEELVGLDLAKLDV